MWWQYFNIVWRTYVRETDNKNRVYALFIRMVLQFLIRKHIVFLTALLIGTSGLVFAQSSSNMARDFWVMFLPNAGGYHQTALDSCTIVATGPEAADITVVSTIDTHTFHLAAGSMAEHLCGTNAGVRGRAFHVTSTADIALYARNAVESSHDVAMVVPTLCLGTRYIVQSAAATQGDTEMLGIVATEDSTVVTVHMVNPNGIPIPPDDINVPADGLLHIPLQRGEAYIVGTQIHRTFGAFSGMDVTSNGRPFALFQGNSAGHVPTADQYVGNHMFEQAVPESQWGHVHLTGGIGEQYKCYYLMTSAEDGNRISFNAQTPQSGETPTLDRGHSQTYVMEPNPYTAISTHTTGRTGYTMMLSSYGASGYCGAASTVMVPSVEHGVQQAWFTVQEFVSGGQTDRLVVFCDTALVHGLRLDGVPINDSSWLDYLPVQTYRTPVGLGAHRLEADSGTFVAFVYGLRNGWNDSYANPVGMALDPYPRDTLYHSDTTCQYAAYRWGPFQWPDGELTDTGTFLLVRNVFDPDTIHRYYLTLTVLPAYRSEVRYDWVPGDNVHVEDTVLSTPGTYVFHHSTGNGCDSTVTLHIVSCLPQQCYTLSRPFIDYDRPVVTFTDCTNGSTSSLWQFSNGTTLSGQSVRHQFHHPLPDNLTVTLHTCNASGCCADTVFPLPVKVRAIWFPNVFIPDAADNNRFGCTTSIDVAEFELTVYNRRGQVIYSTTDINATWDGTHEGTPMPQGAYLYHWYVKDTSDYRDSGNGTVTLLR